MKDNTTQTKPRVLIIGGGLGGLVLAQALRKRDIPFDVFERDSSPTARTQGWAIALWPNLMAELRDGVMDDLPPLHTLSHLANTDLLSEIAGYDAQTMTETFRMGDEHGRPFLRVNRGRMREWLLTDVDVHWQKRFTHYEETAVGVTAFFEDGTSYNGDILVGADGVSSHVRDQLLPNPAQHPKYVPLGSIFGELTATRAQHERWTRYGRSLFVGHTPNIHITIALSHLADDQESAEYYWQFCWTDETAARDDYWTQHTTQEELQAQMLARLDGVHEGFTEPLRATPVAGMICPPLRLRDMVPPELPRGRVTLLGDAVHPMTPFRGEGGNVAMMDGLRMAGRIQKLCGADAIGVNAIANALKNYEAEMRPRATESVLGSRSNASKDEPRSDNAF